MAINIECEERVMLSEEQYFTITSDILRMHPYAQFIRQINYYFDSNERDINNNRMMLRMRVIPGSLSELTLKIKGENGDTEINKRLSAHQAHLLLDKNKFPNGEIYQAVVKLGKPISSYNLLTSLATKRLEIECDGYLLVIDKNEYNGIVDYDLEIESASMDKSKSTIMEYVNKYNLEYKKDYLSKSKRAILTLK